MHLMILAQCYAPEEVSAAVLITELAKDMVKKGHAVTVVTGAPSYPVGRVFPGYRNRIYGVEVMDGVRVVRTWSSISPKKTFWSRIFHYGTYSLTAFYGALRAGKPDLILSYTPPLPLGLTARILSRVWRVPWVLQVEDIFPDAAVAVGVLKNRLAIRFFSWMEQAQYRQADHILVIAEAFRKNLLGKGVPADKMTCIPIWADPEIVKPQDERSHFRVQHGLDGKFVVMYAGNLGLTSCLEDVVLGAEHLNGESGIHFILVGEGVRKAELEKMISERRLQNIQIMPFVPREDFNDMMAAADVNLVTLNEQSKNSSLPSKVINIMASGRPVLAVAPGGSELAMVVKGAECGVVVSPGKPDLLASTVMEMKDHPDQLREMGRNGRRQVEGIFSRQVCTTRCEEIFRETLARRRLE